MKISLNNKKFPIQEKSDDFSVCLISTAKLWSDHNMLANSNNLLGSSSKLCRAQHVRKSRDLLTFALGGRN